MRDDEKQRGTTTRGLEKMNPKPAPEFSSEEIDPQLAGRVLRVVAANQKVPLEKVTLDTTFEELGMDSLDGVNLVFAIEEEFDLSIPDDAAKSIRGVREMAEGVARLVKPKT